MSASKFSWISAKTEFRRHEHESGVVRLARHEILLGDILDVLGDVVAELRLRSLGRFRRRGGLQRIIGLERKFGVDDERRRAVRQMDDAVRPPA